MRYITVLFLLFSLNLFADNIIHHQVTTADNQYVFKVYINDYYIKLENDKFSMTINKEEKDIVFLHKIGNVIWQGNMNSFNKEYKYYAEVLAYENKKAIPEAEMQRIYSDIDKGLLEIQLDSFVKVSQIENNYETKKKFSKAKLLELSCNNISVLKGDNEVAKLLTNKDLAKGANVDIQLAFEVFKKFSILMQTPMMQSFELCSQAKVYDYPMKLYSVADKANFFEEVFAIENHELTNADFNLVQKYQVLNLPDFMKMIIKEKD